MRGPVWQLDDVCLGRGKKPRLAGISVQIRPGVTAVLGPSGAGKSSLLSLLAGFERPSSGKLTFSRPAEFSPTAGAGALPLFWSPQDQGLWPDRTARDHLELVRPDVPRSGLSVDDWLERLQLQSVSDVFPYRLSQGERSRLSLARALASEAACLVLDEPLAHIDPMSAPACLDLTAAHAARSHAVVFSTHDPLSVLRIADRVVCLSDSHCVFSGSVSEVYFFPPTEECAWMLGPAVWIDGDRDPLTRAMGNRTPACIRPHELKVTAGDESPPGACGTDTVPLLSIRRIAGFSELTVRDASGAERRLVTTEDPEGWSVPGRVRLSFVPDSARPDDSAGRTGTETR